MTKYHIPVRVANPAIESQTRASEAVSPEAASENPAAVRAQGDEVASDTGVAAADFAVSTKTRAQEKTRGTKVSADAHGSSEQEEWRERALRLQADMLAYRRRQRRIAQEEARTEQVALLRDVLVIADNLDRALNAAKAQPGEQRGLDPLTQGVEMTRSALQQALSRHGLERIPAQGTLFDPAWHEAVHVVPAVTSGVAPGTVVVVLETGYRRHDVLFRPAKVVVAQ